MYDLYIARGAQNLRVGQSIFSILGVLIDLKVTHPMTELLVGLNEAIRRDRQYGV